MNINELVKDIVVAENLGKKFMYYNTYRPIVPRDRNLRLPFFGKCRVHKVHKIKDEFRLTVEVSIKDAKNAVIGIANHVKNLDCEKIRTLDYEKESND